MKNELTVNVNISIDDRTAERAINILNMYLQDTGREPTIEKCTVGVGYREYYRIRI